MIKKTEPVEAVMNLNANAFAFFARSNGKKERKKERMKKKDGRKKKRTKERENKITNY